MILKLTTLNSRKRVAFSYHFFWCILMGLLSNIPLNDSFAQTCPTWTLRTAPEQNVWFDVTYGNGLFVAIAQGGTNPVMTSPDGVTWTPRAASNANLWSSIAFGGGIFVATAISSDKILRSTDGINWTTVTVPSADWNAVAYGNGRFVIVATAGTTKVVGTSTDGITWTFPADGQPTAIQSVTFGNGKFVALSASLAATTTLTSTDGINWTTNTRPVGDWYGLTYGNNKFVAVGDLPNSINRVMTSTDGITWTTQTAAEANTWYRVVYDNSKFVAISYDGTNRVMTSPDGITWTACTAPQENQWAGLTYANGLFVAVSADGTNRIMTTGSFVPLPVELLTFDGKNTEAGNWFTWTTAQEDNVWGFSLERSFNGQLFTSVGTVKAKGSNSNYQFMDKNPDSDIAYYRLITQDLDGKKAISKTIAIQSLFNSSDKSLVKIYPSVTNGFLNIENAQSFEIVNSVGQVVFNEKQAIQQASITINDLPNGFYIVKGVDTEGRRFVEKINKK